MYNRRDISGIGCSAIEYAEHHWKIFPLNGKVPAIAGGRGVLDATDTADTVSGWWGGPYRNANIGGRVPESMFVMDVDPRNGGDLSLRVLEAVHGPLPQTLTTLSGRGDGGGHYFYRRPPGKLSSRRLGTGIDVKTDTGYVVLPPSIHPDSGKPYRCVEHPVAAPPPWLVQLLLPEVVVAPPRKPFRLSRFFGPSVADEYSANTSWHEILTPHGWRCTGNDPDADGARWLHPAATSACSATIRHGLLFVYSPNTVFEISESGYPRGYTRFRAFAELNYGGDLSAAARALRGVAE